MPNTFVKLATGSGGATTINFTSIPQTYKDLVLVGTLAHGLNFGYADFILTVNGATTNYDYAYVSQGFGATVQYGTSSIRPEVVATGGVTNTELSPIVLTFLNYASTTTHKAIQWRVGSSSFSQTFYRAQNGFGQWRSNTAINQITLTASSGVNWNNFSNLNLYGLASS